MVRTYGWQRDVADERDVHFDAPHALLIDLPSQVDLRSKCPPEIYEQGELGSCTANALAAAYETDRPGTTPSRLFIYYGERRREGTIAEDAGATLRDGVKTLAQDGVCPEKVWPYDVAQFATKPSRLAATQAMLHKLTAYRRVPQVLDQIRAVLAAGHPIVFGFDVFAEFESAAVAETGTVQMPAPGEELLGGHAVMAVGYDDATQRVLCRNSWGAEWGDGGHFTLPYAYVLGRLASDFWTLTSVT